MCGKFKFFDHDSDLEYFFEPLPTLLSYNTILYFEEMGGEPEIPGLPIKSTFRRHCRRIWHDPKREFVTNDSVRPERNEFDS